MRMLRLLAFIVVRDSRHEWHMSFLAVFAVAAVILPLLTLLSMRNGVLVAISSELRMDPRLLEISVVGKGGYTAQDLAAIKDWQEVGFLVPRTRFLTSTITLVADTGVGPHGLAVSLVPTATGDPLLRDLAPPASANEIVLTASVADKMKLALGETVTAIIRYEADDDGSESESRHIERRTLHVTGVLPARLDQRKAIYAPLDLLRNVEAMTEGRPVAEWNWPGRVPEETIQRYASFRVFAASMNSVAALHERLNQLGLEPRSRLGEIKAFQTLDENLTRLMLIIAVLAGASMLVSTGVGQVASVLRKRRDLCLLMLLGYTRRHVAALPLISAVLHGIAGVTVGCLAYALLAHPIDWVFAGRLLPGSEVTRIAVADLAGCLLGTLVICVAASGVAAQRATCIAPSEGLRDE